MKQSPPSRATGARKRLGAEGEALTTGFLESRGYRIIDSNVRPLGGRRRGEIDLVAWHEDCLCFIEVKTRRAFGTSTPSPAEAVNRRKRRQLVILARAYLSRYGLHDIPCRFDVVEIVRRDGDAGHEEDSRTDSEGVRFTLIANAFDADDAGGPDPSQW
ncbi:MAG: YraN family protein [Capsulimonadaceae bacterium]